MAVGLTVGATVGAAVLCLVGAGVGVSVGTAVVVLGDGDGAIVVLFGAGVGASVAFFVLLLGVGERVGTAVVLFAEVGAAVGVTSALLRAEEGIMERSSNSSDILHTPRSRILRVTG